MNLRTNSAFVTIGAILRLGVTLVSIPVLIKFLGLERYGIWTVLNSLVAIGALMEFGINIALTYRISTSYAKQDWEGTKNGLSTSLILMTGLGIVTSLGLCFASSSLVNILFKNNPFDRGEAILAIIVLSWSILLDFWQKWALAVEAAMLRYDLQAIVETASGLALQLGIVVIALAKGGILMLAIWTIFVMGLTLIGHFIVLKHLLIIRIFRIGFYWLEAKELIRFGIMQWLSSFGSTLFSHADRIIVNLLLGAESTGIYSAATSVAVQINKLSAIPLRVIPPAITSAKALSQQSRIQSIFLWATRMNGLLVFLIAAPIMFWSRPLAGVLVGSEYIIQTAMLLQILAICYGMYSLNAAAFFTAVGIGYPIFNARWGMISGILFCLFLFIFISLFGLIGAAWANLTFAISLMINYQVVKLLKTDYWEFIKSFFPVVLMITMWGVGCMIFQTPLNVSWLGIIVFLFLGLISILIIIGPELVFDFLKTPTTIHQQYSTIISKFIKFFAEDRDE